MKPTQAQFDAYQHTFDYFNHKLFADTLPDCMLRFDRQGKGLEGLFNPAGWEKGTQAMPEICLKFRNLKENTNREVTALIVRGMVHLWQAQHGSPSRKGYYNREWAEKMEAIGLIPSDTGEAKGKQTGYGIKPIALTGIEPPLLI